MKKSDPLPRQTDALRAAIPISKAKALPARSIDQLIELEEQRRLLALITPRFLTPNELAIITRTFNLDGEGYRSRRGIAKELKMSLATVLEYEREALESIKQYFPIALAEYERQNFIKRHKTHRRASA